MTTLFNLTRDINGYNGFGLPPADDKQATTLAQSVAQTFTVPSNFNVWLAIFSYDPGLRIFVAYNGNTAAVPGSSVASTTSELLPTARQLNGGTQISVITPDQAAYVQVSYYAIR